MYCSFKRKYVETLGSRSSLNCFQYTALQTMFFFIKKNNWHFQSHPVNLITSTQNPNHAITPR